MKVSKGHSQAQIAAAAFLILYMVLGRPFTGRTCLTDSIQQRSLSFDCLVVVHLGGGRLFWAHSAR